ncbi:MULTISPECIES: DUF4870 family protein [Variovorax]|jgi:uncharacterized membrane protein|uniref:DUF4870 family protein n=1 Tax=Variovorax TaxID=34072 RepID=UPI00086A58D0|nr:MULTISPECIES: hypothetical protein [Variovorax]MBN8753895.1 hypothetical protein [Variovorax sp.]ODU15398.1 MAG: hypothetical protein ABS94_19295 [Variovorax sp. SCN 67-85]ODV24166.1 MAG: hypothetical protein ABT25_16085 [Variovorax sp. SCN 67-20]OJZ04752.1 MAG: hypothetical protein BGP22_15120 [Variovorax sp. 67-131]UKI09960.1 hypothetical protein L3V85_08965 [Variovorax paradoxus]
MSDITTIDDFSSGKTPEQIESLRQITLAVYVLYALSWFTGGLTGIVGIVLNYVKREDAAGTLYQSHFTWQIRTFWWGLCWSILGFITIWILVGFPILFATAVWMIYRLVKGWLNWSERKPMAV